MRKLIYFIFTLSIMACAAPVANFKTTYNYAVKNEQSVYLMKKGGISQVHPLVAKHLKVFNYSRVIESDKRQGFMVVAKEDPQAGSLSSADAPSQLIILKYSKTRTGKTRIDLVNGSHLKKASEQVDEDIDKIATLIKGNDPVPICQIYLPKKKIRY